MPKASCIGAEVSQRLLNVFDLGRPGSVGPAGKSVVDCNDHIAKRTKRFRELLTPGLVTAPPGSPVNGQNGRAVGSNAICRGLVDIQCAVIPDGRVIAEVLRDVVAVGCRAARPEHEPESPCAGCGSAAHAVGQRHISSDLHLTFTMSSTFYGRVTPPVLIVQRRRSYRPGLPAIAEAINYPRGGDIQSWNRTGSLRIIAGGRRCLRWAS